MTFLAAVAAWLANPVHWQGADGIPTRVVEHVSMSGTALGIALAVALPLGLYFGHTGRAGGVVINAANVGRALPSMAVLTLSLPIAFGLGLGLGFWPTVFALVPLGLPPILINTYTAIRTVDADIVEVARGMGMRGWQVLRDAEAPVGAPIIIAGIRTAAVTIVATAALGAIVASGGLGRYIVDGLQRQDEPRLFVGALLVALLAIATEAAFSVLERLLVSSGIRAAQRRGEELWGAR